MADLCSQKVWNEWSRKSSPCGKKGKIEHEGKSYCGIHDPVRREKKAAEKQAEWDIKSARWKRDRDILRVCQGLTPEQVEHAINEWKALYAGRS